MNNNIFTLNDHKIFIKDLRSHNYELSEKQTSLYLKNYKIKQNKDGFT